MALAHDYLTEIHRLLYPEEWMYDDEIEREKESGFLNGEGIREWRIDDLDRVAAVIRLAVRVKVIKPEPLYPDERGWE